MSADRTWPDAVQSSVEVLRRRAPGMQPSVAVLLGSGWSGVADGLSSPVDVPYADLPAFPPLAIAGHAARVRIGRLDPSARAAVMMLMGRQHAYENGDATAMRGAVQTAAALGCRSIVITNAAGSIDASMPPGSLMVLSDHLNLVQRSPLQGLGGSDRFIDMAQAYDAELQALALSAAREEGVPCRAGVYAWMMGPQFETPAEIRMLSRLGADAVGMSTVPETIAARHAGLRVLGWSLITNMAAGLDAATLSHEHTLRTAAEHEAQARRVLHRLLRTLMPTSSSL